MKLTQYNLVYINRFLHPSLVKRGEHHFEIVPFLDRAEADKYIIERGKPEWEQETTIQDMSRIPYVRELELELYNIGKGKLEDAVLALKNDDDLDTYESLMAYAERLINLSGFDFEKAQQSCFDYWSLEIQDGKVVDTFLERTLYSIQEETADEL